MTTVAGSGNEPRTRAPGRSVRGGARARLREHLIDIANRQRDEARVRNMRYDRNVRYELGDAQACICLPERGSFRRATVGVRRRDAA